MYLFNNNSPVASDINRIGDDANVDTQRYRECYRAHPDNHNSHRNCSLFSSGHLFQREDDCKIPARESVRINSTWLTRNWKAFVYKLFLSHVSCFTTVDISCTNAIFTCMMCVPK